VKARGDQGHKEEGGHGDQEVQEPSRGEAQDSTLRWPRRCEAAHFLHQANRMGASPSVHVEEADSLACATVAQVSEHELRTDRAAPDEAVSLASLACTPAEVTRGASCHLRV